MGYDDGGNQTQSKSSYAVDPCCKTCTVPHPTKLIGKAPMTYVSKLNCTDHFFVYHFCHFKSCAPSFKSMTVLLTTEDLVYAWPFT